MTFEDWAKDYGLSKEIDGTHYELAKIGWNAARKAALDEAAKVCRDQEGHWANVNNEKWNDAIEYCATEIEQIKGEGMLESPSTMG